MRCLLCVVCVNRLSCVDCRVIGVVCWGVLLMVVRCSLCIACLWSAVLVSLLFVVCCCLLSVVDSCLLLVVVFLCLISDVRCVCVLLVVCGVFVADRVLIVVCCRYCCCCVLCVVVLCVCELLRVVIYALRACVVRCWLFLFVGFCSRCVALSVFMVCRCVLFAVV